MLFRISHTNTFCCKLLIAAALRAATLNILYLRLEGLIELWNAKNNSERTIFLTSLSTMRDGHAKEFLRITRVK
jgi:hypothetical protein